MGELGILTKNQLLSVLKIKSPIIKDIVSTIKIDEHTKWYNWYVETFEKLGYMSDELLVSLYIREDVHGSDLIYNILMSTLKDKLTSVLVQIELTKWFGDILLDWNEWNKNWNIENTACYMDIISLIYKHSSRLYGGMNIKEGGSTVAYFLAEHGKYLIELTKDGKVLLHKQDSQDIFGKKQEILGNSLAGWGDKVYYEQEQLKNKIESKIASELKIDIMRGSLRVVGE